MDCLGGVVCLLLLFCGQLLRICCCRVRVYSFFAVLLTFSLILTFSLLSAAGTEDRAAKLGLFLGFLLFSASTAGCAFWVLKLLKPQYFLLQNEAAMYPLHNPLNFNYARSQAALMTLAASFSSVTAVLCVLSLFDATDLQGSLPKITQTWRPCCT